jgi:hypothetical protein
MKKLIVITFCLFLVAGTVSAKGNMFVGANAGVSIPLGDFGKAYNLGFGGAGIFMYQLNAMLGLTGSIGYLRYGGDNDISFSSIPLLFGGRYMFGKGDTKPYGTAELGLHFSSADAPTVSFTNPITGQTQTLGGGSASSTNFGIGFGGGVLHPLSKNLYLDANAKFNIIMTSGSSSTYISVMAGVLAAI